MHSNDYPRSTYRERHATSPSPEWFDVGDATAVPAPFRQAPNDVVANSAPSVDAMSPQGRTWWRRAARFVRNAAVGLAILAAVPISVIGVYGDAVLRGTNELTRTRVTEVERLRSLIVPRDASVTPAMAGALMHTLNPVSAETRAKALNGGFAVRPAVTAPERPWDAQPMASDLFVDLRASGNEAAMAAGIITAASRGFSPAEMAYLRSIAEAPMWATVERLVSAPAVDIIGGRYEVPFRRDANAHAMPIASFADTKRMAYAGLSRAAYYVAHGQPERAEAALRTVLSYGFVLVDNGSYTIDGLIGRVIIGIAQDGLHQLYSLSGNANGLALTEPFARAVTSASAESDDAAQGMARLLRDAQDPALPRTIRLEALYQLSWSSCGSVRGMFEGTSSEVREAFAAAASTLARYPSERAYLELLSESAVQVRQDVYPGSSVGERMILGAASATSAVFGNPRIASCTRVVMANR